MVPRIISSTVILVTKEDREKHVLPSKEKVRGGKLGARWRCDSVLAGFRWSRYTRRRSAIGPAKYVPPCKNHMNNGMAYRASVCRWLLAQVKLTWASPWQQLLRLPAGRYPTNLYFAADLASLSLSLSSLSLSSMSSSSSLFHSHSFASVQRFSPSYVLRNLLVPVSLSRPVSPFAPIGGPRFSSFQRAFLKEKTASPSDNRRGETPFFGNFDQIPAGRVPAPRDPNAWSMIRLSS